MYNAVPYLDSKTVSIPVYLTTLHIDSKPVGMQAAAAVVFPTLTMLLSLDSKPVSMRAAPFSNTNNAVKFVLIQSQ